MRAQVVILREGRILMACHRAKDRSYWVLPGGTVEKGESPEQAAARETREESGLEIKVGELLFVDRSPADFGNGPRPRFTYLGHIVGGELTSIEDEAEGDEAKGHLVGVTWMLLDDPLYDELTQSTLRLVRDKLTGQMSNRF